MKLLLVAGARPNFMKIAPLIHASRKHNLTSSSNNGRLTPLLVHTGQHYDIQMSEVFFRELALPSPDINLEVGSSSHAVQTANVMMRFETVCLEEKPDWVIVVGDVNSTMACTLVAAKLGIKVAHVEAGLRSFDRSMPEEINRLVTDSLADLLLTPSPDADTNLLREGISESKVKLVGNVMIDTLIANLEKARAQRTFERLGLEEQKFVYVTLHRPSNVDDPKTLTAIIDQLKKLSAEVPITFPIHPRTHKMLTSFNIQVKDESNLKMVPPVGYHDSICLAEHARFVLTDSGGLQEETTFFRTPCLTLRPNTERPITITEGSNRLTNLDSLWADIEAVLNAPPRIGKVPALWDGKASERIIDTLLAQ